MMTSDALLPARYVAIDPTFGRYPLAPIYLPSDVAMTSMPERQSTGPKLQSVTVMLAAHGRRPDPDVQLAV
jgi:hypothetical protein